MKFEIKHRWSGEILFSLETKSMTLCVEAAIQASVDLRYANLRYADLRHADLRHANLQYANLRYADLRHAQGLSKYRIQPLLALYDQPDKQRYYKLVNANGEGPYRGGIVYEVGKSYEVENADTDEIAGCGEGINIATMDWCLKEWQEGYRILLVEFTAKDIAAIPINGDGKFRLFRCRVIGELNLADYGIGEEVKADYPGGSK